MPSSSSMKEYDPVKISWVAGVFCGEGTTSVHRPRRYVGVRLTIGQSSNNENCPEMLLRVQSILGLGKIYKMKYKKLPHHKTIWQFYIHNYDEARHVINAMWDFLTPEKQEQAISAFDTYKKERENAISIKQAA